jgi:hypothetical protein
VDSPIVGVGLGKRLPIAGNVIDGHGEIDAPAIHLYVSRKLDATRARAIAAAFTGVEELNDPAVNLNIIHTGEIHALACTAAVNPAHGGCSIGNPISHDTGTIGCRVVGLNPPRNTQYFILSNNHVLARCNAGVAGEAIVQPGPTDGASRQIGTLDTFHTLDWVNTNVADIALAAIDGSSVQPDLYDPTLPNQQQLLTIGTVIAVPSEGDQVGKIGRSTNTYPGNVLDVNATVTVTMRTGQRATFIDQISVGDTDAGPFSIDGDSGALVWTWDANRNPVGLVCSGGHGITYVNKFGYIRKLLDVMPG